MSTQENNKLIAEFMKSYSYPKGEDKELLSVHLPEELKYHTSWDWLMPVVEKIDEVTPDNHLFKIEYNRAFLEDVENYHQPIDVFADTRIEATYNVVVEFILWYNEQKQ